MSSSVSVIIPVLNEAGRIRQRLSELAAVSLREVIVVDGGSTDGTTEILRANKLANWISAARGRANQMNAGARAARGDILLFLHADVSLPPDAMSFIEQTLADPTTVAGAFRTWTVADADPKKRAAWLHLADLRSRYSRLPYGDQAIFVRRAAFEAVGGYPDLPLMEDLELSRRLCRVGRIRIVKARVRVSGRRFLAHPIRDTLLVNLFPLLYQLGVPASALARIYRDTR